MAGKVVIGSIIVAAALGAAAVGWQKGLFYNVGDTSYGAIEACEDATKETLQSPTSYVQAWSHFEFRPPVSEAEMVEADRAQREERCQGECDDSIDRFFDAYSKPIDESISRKQKNGGKLTELEAGIVEARASRAAAVARNDPAVRSAVVTLEYDADNRYAAKLRSFGICRFGAIGSDERFNKAEIIFVGRLDPTDGLLAKRLAQGSQ